MEKISKEAFGLLDDVRRRYEKNFGRANNVSFTLSPASLVLLGDHTHYNDGIIVSVAIDKYSAIAVEKRDDLQIHILSHEAEKPIVIDDISEIDLTATYNQFKAKNILILSQILFEKKIIQSGFNFVLTKNIPSCLGLGETVSVLMGFLNSINSAFGLNLKIDELVSLSRAAEQKVIGKISNLAHHYAVGLGKDNKCMFFDLRTNKLSSVLFGKKIHKIIICDTGEKIISPEKICNERIEECEVGVKGLRLYIWGIKNLRDVELDFLQKHIHMIPRRIFSRVFYNVNERLRVENSLKFLKKNKMKDFGAQVIDSHRSLSADYEISNEALDLMVNESAKLNYSIGSKMISCSAFRSIFSIVNEKEENNFIANMKGICTKHKSKSITTYICGITQGMKKITYKEIVLSA